MSRGIGQKHMDYDTSVSNLKQLDRTNEGPPPPHESYLMTVIENKYSLISFDKAA